MDEFVLQSPLDMHVHFRDGGLIKTVAPHTARQYAGCLVMPNLEPIVDTVDRVWGYKARIMNAVADAAFAPYMTLYMRRDYTHEQLTSARPHILAIKFYPQNLTTNSQHGCNPTDPEVHRVLGIMEELDIPLCVHAEAPGYHEDREWLFYNHIANWADWFPKLRIIIEHVSDLRSLRLVGAFPNVFATVTPHHLLLTGDDWVGPPLKPHLFCMPVAKRPADRGALWAAVHGDSTVATKLMLGTDSAPHDVSRKECAECCAGIFTAPIALQLLADLFARESTQERFQAFVSDNARRIYRIQPPAKTIRLVREPFIVPATYGGVVPMWAGQTLPWSLIP